MPMATFVLVHGAFHGAWCWFKLIPELEQRGQRAVALDLPGGGDDPAPVASVTLDDCVKRIVDVVSAEAERVFLVAHSLGGVPATVAVGRVPERLRRLIHLSAFIPKTGDAFSDIRSYAGYPENPGPPHFVYSEDRKSITALPDLVRPRWYNDCAEADIAYSLARYKPVPVAVLTTPIHLRPERYGRVPKSYIHCTLDHGAVPALQETMAEAADYHPNFSLPTGHSPFLSAPALLADTLLAAAALSGR
jgi:pimeloyl-ACP methyl ester carboxylesterase